MPRKNTQPIVETPTTEAGVRELAKYESAKPLIEEAAKIVAAHIDAKHKNRILEGIVQELVGVYFPETED